VENLSQDGVEGTYLVEVDVHALELEVGGAIEAVSTSESSIVV
jgi:hypothetical protein